jgi:hypothetical protein
LAVADLAVLLRLLQVRLCFRLLQLLRTTQVACRARRLRERCGWPRGMGELEQSALSRARAAALALALVQAGCFLVPWARLRIPGGAVFGPLGGAYADVGLVGCLGGDLCDAANAVSKDKGVPPWLKGGMQDNLKDSSLYTASVCATVSLVAAMSCIMGSEYVWWFRPRHDMGELRSGVDVRILLTLAACSLTLLAAALYVPILYSSLHGGEFLWGVYAAAIGGGAGLAYTVMLLAQPADVPGVGVTRGGHFNRAEYGTVNRTVL